MASHKLPTDWNPLNLFIIYIYLLRPREGWSMAKDATLSRRVVMTTRS
jgi:hypothetical protein